ncbi:DUF4384 domain-containing protein [bacterium]|nr:DUF4384 domain-containing protein [bacterium]
MRPYLIAALTASLALCNPLHAQAQDIASLRNSVEGIFDAHCSRCHQEDKLVGRTNAAKGFGNVLDLPALARDGRIVPGNPDNSTLWKLMLSGEMPYDYYSGDFSASTPTKDEIQTVADWIKAEGVALAEASAKRPFITDSEIVGAIAADISDLPRNRVKKTRYLTLANLANAGVPDEELEVYRQAAVKLLNSLSRVSDPARYEKFGPGDTILRFDLDALGWSEKDWRLAVGATPYVVDYNLPMMGFLKESTGDSMPFMRADVFAFATTQPAMYHRLVGIPDDVLTLERYLGVDAEADIAAGKVARAGFQKSGVSQNNRMIERHSAKAGTYWRSYDFATNAKEKSLFLSPLGPGGEGGFVPDGGEYIFSLPNGMQAYMLADAEGHRIEKGPISVVSDVSRPDKSVANGISCMGCHAEGMISRTKDEIRAYVLADNTFPISVREQIEQLHPEQSEMDRLMAIDRDRFESAMRRAGLDPKLRAPGGVEPISALVQHFERNLTRAMAAAEFGLTPDQLSAGAPSAGPQAFALLRRLDQDLVPRDQFTKEFAEILVRVTAHAALELEETASPEASAVKAGIVQAPSVESGTLDLSVTGDKTAYKVNDLAVLTVTASEACYLTLLSVDNAGKTVMLLPNKFAPDPPLLKARTPLVVPTAADEFDLRLVTVGEEKVTAFCNTVSERIAGLDYKFSDEDYLLQGQERELNRSIATARQISVEARHKNSGAPAAKQGNEARKSVTLMVAK